MSGAEHFLQGLKRDLFRVVLGFRDSLQWN